MPRRRLGGAGLLDQDVIVENLHAVRAHQVGGNFGGGRGADDLLEFGNALPVAVIVEETAAFAGIEVFGGIFAGLGHVGLDATAQRLDVIAEQALDQNDSVALIFFDVFLGNERMRHVMSLCWCKAIMATADFNFQ